MVPQTLININLNKLFYCTGPMLVIRLAFDSVVPKAKQNKSRPIR